MSLESGKILRPNIYFLFKQPNMKFLANCVHISKILTVSKSPTERITLSTFRQPSNGTYIGCLQT